MDIPAGLPRDPARNKKRKPLGSNKPPSATDPPPGATGLTADLNDHDASRERLVKSVEHAMDILDLLAAQTVAAGVTQIAAALGLNVSTVHQLLKTLEARGFVSQDAESKLYRLGVRSVQLAEAYLAGLDLYSVAQAALREASRECGETITLAALDGANITTLTTIPGRFTVRSLGATTSRHNAHATALGKVLLAGLSVREMHELVAESGMSRFTPRTIGTLRQLETNLDEVRRQGYALDLEELETGLCCVAVGIPNHRTTMVGAVGVSVPTARFDDERRTTLIELLRVTARRIATRLGYAPTTGGTVG